MARLIWTDPALWELNAIADYIALDHVSAAKKLVKQVFASVERLKRFPQSGRKVPELKKSKYREIISGPCRVIYRLEPEKIYIVCVIRMERELKDYLLKDLIQD